jgi:hypothetical protein
MLLNPLGAESRGASGVLLAVHPNRTVGSDA